MSRSPSRSRCAAVLEGVAGRCQQGPGESAAMRMLRVIVNLRAEVSPQSGRSHAQHKQRHGRSRVESCGNRFALDQHMSWRQALHRRGSSRRRCAGAGTLGPAPPVDGRHRRRRAGQAALPGVRCQRLTMSMSTALPWVVSMRFAGEALPCHCNPDRWPALATALVANVVRFLQRPAVVSSLHACFRMLQMSAAADSLRSHACKCPRCFLLAGAAAGWAPSTGRACRALAGAGWCRRSSCT